MRKRPTPSGSDGSTACRWVTAAESVGSVTVGGGGAAAGTGAGSPQYGQRVVSAEGGSGTAMIWPQLGRGQGKERAMGRLRAGRGEGIPTNSTARAGASQGVGRTAEQGQRERAREREGPESQARLSPTLTLA